MRAAARRLAGGVERGRVRGPRRPDEPPLDARQLPREAGLVADRQPRPAGCPVLPDVAGQPRAHEPPRARPGERAPRSPVVGARIISGLIPCNVIPDEILTDHPRRYRAMIVESGNPAHSIADSQRMREAIEQLEVVVCIDVFMTETARLADYVLPALTQFEKHEATFFNFEFPRNVFHLRRPVVDGARGPAAGAGDPRPPRRGGRAPHRRRRRPAAGRRRSAAGPSSPPPSPPPRAPIPASVRSAPCCCTARSARRCPTAPPARRRCGR